MCMSFKDIVFFSKPATNVKVGESRLCHLDYCSDNAEEQNLQIISKLKQSATAEHPTDLVLFEVAAITFNKNVRPACLFYQLQTIQSQGWFARYGKAEDRKYYSHREYYLILDFYNHNY